MATVKRYYLQELEGDKPVGRPRFISEGGTRMGRHPRSDVVFPPDQPGIHTHHAALLPKGNHVLVQALDRIPPRIRGVAVEGQAHAYPGSVLEIGPEDEPFRFEFGCETVRDNGEFWLVNVDGRTLYRVEPRLTVGGGVDDKLHVEGWPERAFTFYETDGALVVETKEGVVAQLGDEPMPEMSQEQLGSGDFLEFRDSLIKVYVSSRIEGARTIQTAPRLNNAIRFERHPQFGGTLTLTYVEGGAVEVIKIDLPEKRADLLHLLIEHAKKHGPYDRMPDEQLARWLWPGEGKGREEINQLLFHTRKQLLETGVNGKALLVKERGGTRLGCAPDTELETR